MSRAEAEKQLKEVLEDAAKLKARAQQLKSEAAEDEAALKELKDIKSEAEKAPE